MAFHIANNSVLVNLGEYPVWFWVVQVMGTKQRFFIRYEPVAIKEDPIRTGISLELLSKGTAWFDLMKIISLSENY